jgi:hypothetical protein
MSIVMLPDGSPFLRAGNQQYTARGLKFNGCTTAVQMIWSWGFNWQQVEVNGGAIAFNITGKGGDSESEVQGTGSMAVIGLCTPY